MRKIHRRLFEAFDVYPRRRTLLSGGDVAIYLAERCQINPVSNCFEWCLATDPDGYGVAHENSVRPAPRFVKNLRAHRLAYEVFVGDIGRFYVLHKCDNPKCCNPEHLFLGTAKDNHSDSQQKGRHSHGETQGASKFTEADIRAIRSSSESLLVLSKIYGVTKSAICSVRLRKTWRHVA